MSNVDDIVIVNNYQEFIDSLPSNCISLSLPGKPLTGKERYSKIYHTTSLNSFLLIWATKKLKFSSLTGVNDMKEMRFSIGHENQQLLPMLFAMHDVRKSYKQISFTMDFDSSIKGYASPLIWGVYGDKNKGVCIELDYQKLKFSQDCFCDVVEYKDRTNQHIEIPEYIVTVNSLKSFIRTHQKEIFFVKDICWEHENEYRVISDSDGFLDISEAITAVYVADIDGLAFEILNEILKDTKIKFGYVHIDKGSGVLFASDARMYKQSVISSENKPKNCLRTILKQAEEHYISNKDNPNADLTKIEYNLCHD